MVSVDLLCSWFNETGGHNYSTECENRHVQGVNEASSWQMGTCWGDGTS